MRSARSKFIAVVLVASACALGLSVPASAQEKPAKQAPADSVNADIMVLHATQAPGPGSIDPRIGSMPQLKKPPFSSYNTYKLIGKQTLLLGKGTPGNYSMINGSTLLVTLLDVTAEKRFHVHAAINQPSGQPYLKGLDVTAASNEPFFVAGQPYQDGNLILAITMRPVR